MTRWFGVALGILCFALTACQGSDPLPTNAPVIPPTATITFTPSHTPVSTPNPLTPTGDIKQPSWTPSPSPTFAPTNTLLPSITPLPTLEPTQGIEAGNTTLEDGTLRITLAVDDLNAILANSPNQPHLTVELDSIRVSLTIHNDFLKQDTTIQAGVTPSLEAGQFKLTLATFSSEGPIVTRSQLQTAITDLNSSLATAIQTVAKPNTTEYTNFQLASGFLILDIRK